MDAAHEDMWISLGIHCIFLNGSSCGELFRERFAGDRRLWAKCPDAAKVSVFGMSAGDFFVSAGQQAAPYQHCLRNIGECFREQGRGLRRQHREMTVLTGWVRRVFVG